MSTGASSPINPKDKWIPRYFFIFFIVVAILDGIFVTLAITTHTGLVTEKAYEKGLAYNEVLERAEKQKSMGIQARAEYKDNVLTLRLKTREDTPLKAEKVVAKFYRPSGTGHDYEVQLEDKGDGLYQAAPAFPLSGLWTTTLEAQWHDQQQQRQNYTTTLSLTAP